MMNYVQHQQYQSPTKVTGSCYWCKKSGHWVNSCPERPLPRSPVPSQPVITVTSCDEFPAILCLCGVGLCVIKFSHSVRNPDRKYYCCPAKNESNCRYFKWCDELKREEIRTFEPENIPICGCGAGVCSVTTEVNGDNAGRSYFICPIKKGEGACSFRQTLDNCPESTSTILEGPISDQRTVSVFDEPGLSHGVQMQIDALQMIAQENSVQEIQVPVQDDEGEMVGGVCERPGETPVAHPHGVPNNISESLHHKQTIQSRVTLENQMGDLQTHNVQASAATTVSIVSSTLSEGTQPWADRLSNISNILKDGVEGSIMSGTIIQTFDKLAQLLKNNLISLLESMSPQNHAIMKKEADCTFAALDHLQMDYGLFQSRVNEYIKLASSLCLIEQNFNNHDASAQELIDHHNNEQRRFDEISKAYCDEAFMESNQQRTSLFERASCTNNGLVEELSSCEVDNGNRQGKLLQITKSMAECHDSLQAASLKAVQARKNAEKWKIEWSAAEAKLHEAKAQLRY